MEQKEWICVEVNRVTLWFFMAYTESYFEGEGTLRNYMDKNGR